MELPNGLLGSVLTHFKGITAKPDGSFMVLCPAHDDRNPSLSVRMGRDGRVVLNCHAKCKTEAVVEHAGLTMAELFPPSTRTTRAAAESVDETRDVFENEWDYTDKDGTLLYKVRRYRKPDGKKRFAQRRPDGKGGWIWKLDDVTPVIYRWPEIAAAVESGREIYVVEGEKCADALAVHGYAVTTNPMGALKWQESYSEALKGAECVVLPDNDDKGKLHAEQVATSLTAQGCTVRVVELPNLPSKGDIADWLEDHTLDELGTLVGQARIWTPDIRFKTDWLLDEILSNDELMRPPMPVIPRLAWHGRSTMIAAGIKTGKSTLTGFLAAQVSKRTGGQFLGDPCQSGDVLVVCLEEALGDLGRRLRHFQANGKHVRIVSALPSDAKDRPQAVIDRIEKYKPLLVIVDTLGAYARGLIDDENNAAQTQAIVQELTDISHSLNVAMVLVHHANRQGKYRGSSAMAGAVDVVVEITKPEERDPTLRKADCMGRMPVHDFRFRYDGTLYVDADGMGLSLMQRVLNFVRANPRQSQNSIRIAVGGKHELVDEAINALLQKRFIYDAGDRAGHAYEASTAAPASVI